ncbi:hypothetical protein [uncultured Psychromonas sp.]|uniref:hypothetical protein n=1 Tax=uncultured Psychromonas sp. TaxID=173974 RepID=UPI002613B87F|nr:hypothetical protein [uncultured Psychromonas sp.]
MVGIIKFFRDMDKLNQFVEGLFYCNTPEFYRLSESTGVSDLNESCVSAFRKSRGDDSCSLFIDGRELSSIESMTLQRGDHKDSWMHCWFALTVPDTDADLKELFDDINRIRIEFGCNYVFMESNNITEFVSRISTVTKTKLKYELVSYSKDSNDWNAICKSSKYSYQREYRFLVGECKHNDIQPIKLKYEQGFADLVYVNKKLELTENNNKQSLFYMDQHSCCLTS